MTCSQDTMFFYQRGSVINISADSAVSLLTTKVQMAFTILLHRKQLADAI